MTKTTYSLHAVFSLPLAAVAPGFPPGVLGKFIQKKLKDYVEPTRAGTPKGEAVGLSRKKFHAALLYLTSLELSKQAKLIGVSHGVLRKWRTEEALLEEARQLEREFLDGPFIYAAKISMDMLLNLKMEVKTENDINLEVVTDKRRLIGFEDAEVYSAKLLVAIKKRFEQETRQAVDAKESEETVLMSLAWARPLGRLYRSVKGNVDPFRRAHAVYLSVILTNTAVWARSESEDFTHLAWTIGRLIVDALND